VHLNCTVEVRTTQPTVILESGTGDFSVERSLVQRVRSRLQVMAGANSALNPRIFHQVAYELHTVLDQAANRSGWPILWWMAGAAIPGDVSVGGVWMFW